jgi:hypothetical protein
MQYQSHVRNICCNYYFLAHPFGVLDMCNLFRVVTGITEWSLEEFVSSFVVHKLLFASSEK